MARFTILTVLALAACSFAQVTVTNSNFATTPGPAIPATPVSPPIVYTPIIQLGQGPTQPVRAYATQGGLMTIETQPQETQQNATLAPAASATPFNFGVAQFDAPAATGGVGQDINGKSLGEIARERRQHAVSINARTYTNSDIDQLNQTGNSVNNPSAQSNADNWSPNNGVINPNGTLEAQPNAVGAPPQQNQSPTGVHSPFAPKPQSYSPAGIDSTPSQPPARPQADIHPLRTRDNVELAQNNPPAPPQDQAAQSQPAPAQDQAQTSQLPRTASKLPLLGVAGLFSVTMGIFVRYQRAKAR